MKMAPIPAWLDEKPYREDIFATIIDASVLHLDAPREVNVIVSDRTMQTWDSMFLDNLARDGILLYVRGSLPAPLAHGRGSDYMPAR